MIYLQVLLLTLQLIIATVTVSGQSCADGNLRLTEISSENEGNVQVCRNELWSPVCLNSNSRRQYRHAAARLICQELGFSSEGYQIKTSTATSPVLYYCRGRESRLMHCLSHYSSCRQQVRIHCREQSNEIPEIISNTSVATTVSLKWGLETIEDVIQHEVECSSARHVSRLLVDNQTFTAHIDGLLPSSDYNCCVLAVFNSHKTKSCVPIRTSEVPIVYPQCTVRDDTNTVGGVLGFFIIFLLLLLILALLALLYPCLIRPRAQKSRIHMVLRLSDILDQKLYSNIYRNNCAASTVPVSSSKHERSTIMRTVSDSTRNNSVPTGSRKTCECPNTGTTSVGTEIVDVCVPVSSEAAYEAPNSGTTDSQRVYEPTAYEIPSDCLGQVSVETDHVYAVLEEPN